MPSTPILLAKKVGELCAECPVYGKTWFCPPFDFDVDEFLGRYDYAYLFAAKITHDELI
ncbi:MAG: DUF2284 domain-containing protein [Synergistaceae bacterium]|jgi:predicted metal-binding protein|nr:DUF2284 domain-containing protein [Synergistaceae bacterium]